jgi:hypothetical protein
MGGSESHTLLKAVNEFVPTLHVYCIIWVELDIRDKHVKLFSTCEFRENRREEGRTFFLMDFDAISCYRALQIVRKFIAAPHLARYSQYSCSSAIVY